MFSSHLDKIQNAGMRTKGSPSDGANRRSWTHNLRCGTNRFTRAIPTLLVWFWWNFVQGGLRTKHLSICEFHEKSVQGRPHFSYGCKSQLQFCVYFRINPSLLPSLTHSHSLSLSLTHSLTHSLSHSLTLSLTHSFKCSISVSHFPKGRWHFVNVNVPRP